MTDRPLRVCIVTTSFPRWLNDSRGTFILEAARALQAKGLQVRVVAMHSPGAQTHEIWDNLEIFRPRYLWPDRLEILQKEAGGLPVMWRKSWLARLSVIPFLLAHILGVIRHAQGCDVIHCNWTLSAIAAWLGSWVHRRPMVVTVQGSDIYQAPSFAPVRVMTRLALNGMGRVLTLSRSLAEATAALGIAPDRITILPNGVDTNLFRPAAIEREPMLLFVGSLIERKGVATLIKAMHAVSPYFPEHRLVLAGDGPQQPMLENLARELGEAERVVFLGAQSQPQVADLMRRARIFVLASVEEGLGVVLLEALASGTPCVASNVGGIPDIVTPSVGVLVPPADVTALAAAIRQLLADPQQIEAMRQSARQRALERFSWSSIAERLLSIYADVIRSASAPRPPFERSQ